MNKKKIINGKIINGKIISELIIKKINKKILKIKIKKQRSPTLAIIKIGDNKISENYIKNKKNACEKVGIICKILNYPNNITESFLIKIINYLNYNPNIDAILIQLPLPININNKKIINSIKTKKDVDGFTPEILGNLIIGNYELLPGTVKGIITILKYYKIKLSKQNIVIINHSNIIGKPLANVLINYSATVTVCHSKTKNLYNFTKKADILISAVGKKNFITSKMIKKNVIIIDVGINYDENNILYGDVDFKNVLPKVKMITPVPGGVGPMTIASLLENILYLYQKNRLIKNTKK